MRSLLSLAAALPATLLLTLSLPPPLIHAIRIVQSDDDGWAELYVRTLNDVLNAAGHKVILSAPADNKSGTGSFDKPPSNRVKPCHYNSCPANAGPSGANSSRPDLRWVNSYPATSIRYAIETYARELWGLDSPPELALTGPNTGANVWFAVEGSGTVGAAVEAVRSNIPAVAFSVASTATAPWDADPRSRTMPAKSRVYAELARNLTEKLIASGKPYLPEGVFLNVNIREATDKCADASRYKWILTRITPGLTSPPDVKWCGSRRLPTETDVILKRSGCYVAVSIGDASDKTTVNDKRQGVVLEKIRDMLSCLP